MLKSKRQRIGCQRRDTEHSQSQHALAMQRFLLPHRRVLHMLPGPSHQRISLAGPTHRPPRLMETQQKHTGHEQRDHQQEDRPSVLHPDPQFGNGQEPDDGQGNRNAPPCPGHRLRGHEKPSRLKSAPILLQQPRRRHPHLPHQ